MSLEVIANQPGLTTKGQYGLILDGKPVFSVTKALSVIDKPALIKWAVKMSIENLRVTWEPDKSYPVEQRDALLAGASGAAESARSGAKDSGGKVADWVDDYVKRRIANPKGKVEMPARPEGDPAALATIESFLDWELDNRVRWLASEWKMADPFSLIGGRADEFAELGSQGGKPFAIDCKRLSTVRLYPEHELQLSAYAVIATSLANVKGKQVAGAGLIPGVKAQDVGRLLLALPAVGGEAQPFEVNSDVYNDWDALLAAATLRRRIPEYGRG